MGSEQESNLLCHGKSPILFASTRKFQIPAHIHSSTSVTSIVVLLTDQASVSISVLGPLRWYLMGDGFCAWYCKVVKYCCRSSTGVFASLKDIWDEVDNHPIRCGNPIVYPKSHQVTTIICLQIPVPPRTPHQWTVNAYASRIRMGSVVSWGLKTLEISAIISRDMVPRQH